MKKHSTDIRMFLSAIFLAGTIFFPVHAQEYGLKKGRNISLSIKGPQNDNRKTYFNLGLLSNYQNLNGASINAISDVVHQKTSGFQLSGFVNIVGNRSSGMQVAGLANISGIRSHGLRIGGLFNISGKSTYGAQFSGIGNLAGNNQKGLMVTGLINMGSVDMKGFLVSGLANIAGNEQKGLAISGMTNVSGGNMHGAQISSLMNIAGGINKGLQLTALSNVSVTNKGLQLSGVANYAGDNKGLQVGLANVSNKCSKGVQIGIFNLNGDSCARQIGIVNMKPQTHTQIIVSGGNLNKANIAVRFKNRLIYTQLGASMILGELTDKASVAGIYRTGLAFPIIKDRLHLNTDIGYCHIETLGNSDVPNRLYAIQPRIGLEYNPMKKIGIFIAGGYSWERTYKNNLAYSRHPIVEAGLVFF
ncbi:hypothetical protein [uncultured Bacteroides sp.]|uniref:LA_2272 family surface repeat-containing protein n=1 Tax=uncultured Bacteroides sp. TaxID=162156 RepID=UPI002637724F|nr:hypothetical protein [uncultured Bacteroides sp.]